MTGIPTPTLRDGRRQMPGCFIKKSDGFYVPEGIFEFLYMMVFKYKSLVIFDESLQWEIISFISLGV